MESKKILIVSHSFYPQNSPRSYRTTELAKEFARQGHKVTVLIPELTPEQTDFCKREGLKAKTLGRLRWKSPDFGSSKAGFLLTRAAHRILSLGFEYPYIEVMFLVNRALKKENGYDLLISIAVPYPIHWGVTWARKKKHRIAQTWVADCGDPYMGCVTDSFKKLFYFKYIEKWFMRRADFISIPVETAKAAYYTEFHKKIKVIPQGFKITPMVAPGVKYDKATPRFAYAGSFIPGIRDPRQFLDFLTSLKNTDYTFYIFTNKPDLVKGYTSQSNSKIIVNGFIPRDELLPFLAQMDFLVNFDNNTKTAVPSKLIDYAITGKPVLNIENPLVPDRIINFLRGDYSHALEMPDIDRYRIENVCGQFITLATIKDDTSRS
jgi:glycosyltransferase involved in cell wall biosynthesis